MRLVVTQGGKVHKGMKQKTILSVVGARPQFIKAAALSPFLRRKLNETLLHTGQHYDYEMSKAFFNELAIPEPDIHLDVGSGTHGEQTAKMVLGIEKVCLDSRPDLVMVYGDTNSTLAGALVASKLRIPLGHVEAGLRSYDQGMPEEVNRAVTDRLSTLLFCPTDNARVALKREGIEKGVYVTGDVMYDLMMSWLPKARRVSLKPWGVAPQGYVLATVHRAGNADDPQRLQGIMEGLGRLVEPVVFPLHPRTKKALEASGMKPPSNLRLVSPVGYLAMLALEQKAKVILTDSGGVQKEAYWLGVPCVTLREETEWIETQDGGWNILAGCDPDLIQAAALRRAPHKAVRFVFGNGTAARKISATVESFLRSAERFGKESS